MDLADGVRDKSRVEWIREHADEVLKGMIRKKISNDQELTQSDPISCPQNLKGKN